MNSINKLKCPCCEFYTLDAKSEDSYAICPVCFWEDDPVQRDNPDMSGGANRVSLNEARANFKEYGACDENAKAHVRKPTQREKAHADLLYDADYADYDE